ncbi:hypothetical protein GCM10009589_11110 [Arthrobacter pascens]
MFPVLDDLEVEVAPGGRSCGTHLGNDLTDTDSVALGNCHGLEVVVRGDEPIAMVDLHPVSAAPRMPSCGSHNSGIGRVDTGATGSGEILAPVELTGFARQGVMPQAEGGTRIQNLERGHEETCTRPPQGSGCDAWGLWLDRASGGNALGARLHDRPAKGYFGNQRRRRTGYGAPLGRAARIEQRRANDAGGRYDADCSLVKRPSGGLEMADRRLEPEREDGEAYDNCRRQAPQSDPSGAVRPGCTLVSPMSCHRILLM